MDSSTLAEYCPIDGELPAPFPPAPRPYVLWTVANFEAYQPPPDSFIWGEGILQRGELCYLIGPGGVGKSRLATALCVAQKAGEPRFADLPLHQGRLNWLFIGSESSARRWKTDLCTMLDGKLAEHRAAISDGFQVAATFEDEDPDLTLDHAQERIAATLDLAQPDVVVMETWADLIPGDENKTEDARAGIGIIRRLARKHAPEAAILIIGHARPGRSAIAEGADCYAGGSLMRGNKALHNSCRAGLALLPGDAEDATQLVLVCAKCNDGPKFQTKGLTFDPKCFSYRLDPTFELDHWRDDVEGKRSQKRLSIQDLVGAVRDGVTETSALEQHFADLVSDSTVKQRLRQAVVKGYLTREGRGHYSIGAKGGGIQ